MKLNLPAKLFLSAISYIVVAEIVSILSSYLTMNYYTDPAYFSVWSKIMMPSAGPPPSSFYYFSITFAFIGGLIFAYVYYRVQSIFKTKSLIQKGLRYGFGFFIVVALPLFMNMYLLINLPLDILVSWLIFNGLIVNLITGIVVAKIFA